jgi:hypothetical protein
MLDRPSALSTAHFSLENSESSACFAMLVLLLGRAPRRKPIGLALADL